MTDVSYSFGDLVWAKMKGFSPWPGRIAEPPENLKKLAKKNLPAQCIFFFGSNNFAWIEESNIKPYELFKSQLIKTSKSNAFKEAVDAIEQYIANPEEFEAQIEAKNRGEEIANANADFDKLLEYDGNDESTSSIPSSPAVSTPAAKKASAKKEKKAQEKPKAKSAQKKKLSTGDEVSPITPKRPKRQSAGSAVEHNDVSSLSDLDNYGVLPTRRTGAAATHLLNRPTVISRPDLPEIDMNVISKTLKSKNISPSSLTFGFLGLGIMGCGIVKNLINSGHKVVVWNRTYSKCRKFADAGAEIGPTPSDVVDSTDITFSCVADPQAAKDMVFGNCGVLQARSISNGKGYVEMTGIDSETSQDIAEAIISKGGRYLEAQIQGSKPQAEEGTLIILAAGERSLFDDCQTCFEAMGRNSFYLGDVGNASKMNLVLQTMAGVCLAGLAEAMALADRAGLQQKDVLEVLELTNMASQMILDKGQSIIKGEFPTHLPLMHMQKDLRLSLTMGDALDQPLPLTATSNEVFKHAKRAGYGDHDASAVYFRARF